MESDENSYNLNCCCCCGDSEFMLWNSLLLLECSSSSYFVVVSILKLPLPTGRYVVPTGRVIATDSVIVATSGYVVPAAYDISPGRVKHYLSRSKKGDILLVRVYVYDIIFGSTNKELCTGFEKLMKDKFQMSSIGELTFFLGLQVAQKEDGIFISQDKYVAEILKKFNYTDVKFASTPIDLEKPLVKDGDADDVDVHLYRSMIGSLMYLTASRPDIMFAIGSLQLEVVSFLGNRLISWQYKKQTMVSTSTTKAEYVAVASCCGQLLWIQNQLMDYGYNFMNTVINIDNNSTICIIENHVQHSKTKHIEIRHHFIRDCNAKKLIQMVKIHTDYNVADLFTKGFDAGRFQYSVSSIGMLNP
ncbi:putative ribonuclease H-like domain-containing protein [Tanacetum coccineum]